MPTYSYRCASCDFAFDQYQAFTDDSLTVCPNCGQPQLRKVFNSIGVTFNGSGFYRTDSRAKGGDSTSGSTSSTSGDSSGSSSSGGDGGGSKPKAVKPKAAPAAAGSSGSASKSGSANT
ncbi:MAG TPA: FmdB family zinc ribbon protein [Lacisediminihabitans sp.]|nr:FmdB family zinc ribbon protein [Lacisediminihabitans sp.]HXD62838.1 FmdB family zinc ribbon protein [Lacisediminihabitans sp.]